MPEEETARGKRLRTLLLIVASSGFLPRDRSHLTRQHERIRLFLWRRSMSSLWGAAWMVSSLPIMIWVFRASPGVVFAVSGVGGFAIAVVVLAVLVDRHPSPR